MVLKLVTAYAYASAMQECYTCNNRLHPSLLSLTKSINRKV